MQMFEIKRLASENQVGRDGLVVILCVCLGFNLLLQTR